VQGVISSFSIEVNFIEHTQCGPKVLGLIFFLNLRLMRKTHTLSYSEYASLAYIQAFPRSYSF
jgi:hypothetical protein